MEFEDNFITIYDDNGDVVQKPEIVWNYPSGVEAFGHKEIIGEPMQPGDIIKLASDKKQLLKALELFYKLLWSISEHPSDKKIFSSAEMILLKSHLQDTRELIAKARGEQ